MKLIVKSLLLLLLTLCYCGLYAQKKGRAAIDSLLKELPRAVNDTGKVNLYNGLSNYCANYSTDSGLLFGGKGLELATSLNWPPGIANANYFLGFNYYNKSDYPDAL